MNAEGRAFSDARYTTYATGYAEVFLELPEYGVVDEPANYGRAEQLLDHLYAEWVAAGRPKAPPKPAYEEELSVPSSIKMMLPPGVSEEHLSELLAPWQDSEVTVVPPPTWEQMPHVSPDLEALIPRDLASPPMQLSSVRATEWGSSLLNRALKRLEIRPRDAVVVAGLGGYGQKALTVTIYGLPGAPAERLHSEFQSVIFRLPGSNWQRREIGGREVNWASGEDFNVAYWARDGMVIHLAGEAREVESAIERLP